MGKKNIINKKKRRRKSNTMSDMIQNKESLLSMCGRKKRYINKEDASSILSRFDNSVRIYKCPHCHGYHITNKKILSEEEMTG